MKMVPSTLDPYSVVSEVETRLRAVHPILSPAVLGEHARLPTKNIRVCATYLEVDVEGYVLNAPTDTSPERKHFHTEMVTLLADGFLSHFAKEAVVVPVSEVYYSSAFLPHKLVYGVSLFCFFQHIEEKEG